MAIDKTQQSDLAAFGEFILMHRDEITRYWVTVVDRSPEVQAAENLTYRQLLDHLPQLCTELAHLLHDPTAEGPREEASYYSSEHGAKRWEQGYRLEELIREICLIRKDFIGRWFEAFEEQRAPLPPATRRLAKRIVYRFFDDLIIFSTLQFVEEQQRRVQDAEMAMQSATQRAETADEARRQFLRLVSHELRAPLTPMLLGAAELEMESSLSPEARELVGVIRHHTRLEAALVDDLIDASLLAHDLLAPRREEIDIHACIRDALKECAYDLQMKQIEPEMLFSAQAHFMKADDARMRRAFSTLFRNAAKVSQNGGRITVRTRNTERAMEVLIQDSAVDPDQRMEEMASLSVAESRLAPFAFGALGLSRYVCKAMIESHGGTITAPPTGSAAGALLVTLPLSSISPILK
ncbi:MAG: sensor histidine kinase [Chthoniobacterales bacterium]